MRLTCLSACQSADGGCACQSPDGEAAVVDGGGGVHWSGYRGECDGGAQDGGDEGFVAGECRGGERCSYGEDCGGRSAAAEGRDGERCRDAEHAQGDIRVCVDGRGKGRSEERRV